MVEAVHGLRITTVEFLEGTDVQLVPFKFIG